MTAQERRSFVREPPQEPSVRVDGLEGSFDRRFGYEKTGAHRPRRPRFATLQRPDDLFMFPDELAIFLPQFQNCAIDAAHRPSISGTFPFSGQRDENEIACCVREGAESLHFRTAPERQGYGREH